MIIEAMPAEPKLIKEELQRVNLPCFVWLRSLDAIITRLHPKSGGWRYKENLKRKMPKWFTGRQTLPSHTKSTKFAKHIEGFLTSKRKRS